MSYRLLDTCSEIQDEIHSLEILIAKLHVTAWRHRVNKNIDLMRGVHRRIKAAKKRIADCEWMLRDLDADFWKIKVVVCLIIFQLAVISFIGTELIFEYFGDSAKRVLAENILQRMQE
jgi:hypothetical protein